MWPGRKAPEQAGGKSPDLGASGQPGAAATARQERGAELRQPPRLSGRSSYSFFVVTMKVLLPALATALILLVVVWPKLSPEDDRFRISVSSISLEQADNLTMLNPRFDGIDERNQPYSVTADLAIQNKADDNLVDLELPKADVTLEDGTWLALMAKTGRYHREAETVDLIGDVIVFHDEGFEVKTQFAHINLNGGTAEGDEPVEAHGPTGLLNSEGFRIENEGERIFFTGKARMVMYQ